MNKDELSINTIRMLAADQVEQAKSGHPGMPLGAAPMAYVLWTKIMRHNPYNPDWPNRDRFILSAGHGSALLYALMHLTGYELSLDELKNFRQYDSKTPGHPEYWCTPGVEATTGPLGQGFGMGVGMAIAERFMSNRYKRKDFNPIDHYTYAIVSDGDLMEGIASEAASIAGHLKLGKLVYLYDDNHISIEGDTNLTFTESVPDRFKSYGWHVQQIKDGNDINAIETAIRKAQESTLPSLVCIRTHIGYGSPKQDSARSHGEPLGQEAIAKTRENFGWPADKTFFISEEVRTHLLETVTRGQKLEEEWNRSITKYKESFPDDYQRLMSEIKGTLPENWDANMPSFLPDKTQATRASSGKAINALATTLPNLIGGSADLAPSCKTTIEGGGDIGPESNAERNIHFGVREHAMGAIVNGMALHGGVIPYGSTFLIFSDYMRPSIRLSALMNVHSIFVFTHDSVGVGEDGPTHQPIEQMMSLRAIPNLIVFRPADANETVYAWKLAIERKGPVAFALSRQNLPVLDPKIYPIKDGVKKGAYIISDCDEKPRIIIIATGSELHIALEVQNKLTYPARVVSMPSWEIFEEQPQEYKDKVLPPDIKTRLAIEAGITLGWQKWVGDEGEIVGIDRFGVSAPGKTVMEKLGINVDAVLERAKTLIKKKLD